MAHQPERAWALLLLLSLPAAILAPTFPTLAIVVLAFTRVRTHWAEISANTDAHAHAPIERTSRIAALVIMVGVLLAGSIGMHSMHQSAHDLRALTTEQSQAFPGASEGPTVSRQNP